MFFPPIFFFNSVSPAKDLVQPARRLLQEWPVKKPNGDPETYVLVVLFNDAVGLFSGRNEGANLKFKKLVTFGPIFEIGRNGAELRFRFVPMIELNISTDFSL